MTPPQSSPRRLHVEVGLFLILAAGGLLLLWRTTGGAPRLEAEGVIRVGVAHDLLEGLPRGRQGLIGSLRWGPLPTVMMMPVSRLPAPFGGDWAPVFTGLVCAAFLSALVCAWLARCGVGRLTRLAVSLALFLSPALQGPVAAGTAEPVFLLLIVSGVCFLLHWWETEQLRSLAYLSLALALAALTRYQAVVLAAVAAAFVAAHVHARRHQKHYAEATLTIFLVPALYALALWLVANWLIMGDAFFFLRGLARLSIQERDFRTLLNPGYEWGKALALSLAAWVIWRLRVAPPRLRGVAVAAFALLVCLPLWYAGQAEPRLEAARRSAEIASLCEELARDHREDWIIYSGYEGYLLARPHEGRRVLYLRHDLSFYPDLMLRDTRGKRGYVLVPRPEGAAAWEDMNLKWPAIFERGAPFTVFERTWGNWVLLRVVRLDEAGQG